MQSQKNSMPSAGPNTIMYYLPSTFSHSVFIRCRQCLSFSLTSNNRESKKSEHAFRVCSLPKQAVSPGVFFYILNCYFRGLDKNTCTFYTL